MAKVLVIEGDADTAQTLRDALVAQKVEVEVVADGNEGLNKVRTFQPNVIVLCVELPRISGYSICNKLKKDPTLASIPLILTSSQATDETFEQHKKLKTRAEGYVKKPYDLAVLLGMLAEYIPLRAGTPATSRPARAPAKMGDDHSSPSLAAPSASPRRPTVDNNLSLDLNAFDDVSSASTAAPRTSARPAAAARASATRDSIDLEADLAAVSSSRPRTKTGEFGMEVAPAGRPRAAAADLGSDATTVTSSLQSRSGELNLDTVVAQARPRVSTSTSEINLDLPAARPRPRPGEISADVGSAPTARAPDPQVDHLRNETRQLRQKVQQLEQTLQQKELEFNDRLLEEAARSRDSVDLKKKIQILERDLGKYQQAAETARAEADAAVAASQRAQEEQHVFASEREAFTEKMASLLEKVKALAAERQDLQREVDEARQAHQSLLQELEASQKARQKAKKAVDIAVQLLEETGLFDNPPS